MQEKAKIFNHIVPFGWKHVDLVREKNGNNQFVGRINEAGSLFLYNIPGFTCALKIEDIVPLARLKEREPRYEYEWMISYKI